MMPTQPVSPEVSGGAVGWTLENTSLYPNIPLPTFSETDFHAKTIKDKEDNEHTRLVGNQQFAPRYPVYNFQPSAPMAD